MTDTINLPDPIADAFHIGDLFSGAVSPLLVLLTLAVAFVIGMFVFFIYKKTFGGVLYSRTFNTSLVLVTMVTSLVLLLINNNLTMSLGTVGALSIVRFRTAVKEPMDIVFMFWAIAEGMALGAQFFDVALIAALVIGVVMVIFSLVKRRGTGSYLLIIHYHEAATQQINGIFKRLPGARIKSKTAQPDAIELTLEVRLNDSETNIAERLMRIEGVYDASLISHQGDMIS